MAQMTNLLPFVGEINQAMTGQYAQMQQNRANQMMSQQEFAQNVGMWKMQNEYNLPKNQMDRLAQAGLNPNLVYGNGSVVGNTIGQAPQYHRPEQVYRGYTPDFPNALAQYQDFQLKKATIDNVQAIASQNKSKAILADIQARYFGGQGEMEGNRWWFNKSNLLERQSEGQRQRNQILASQATSEAVNAKYAEDIINRKLAMAGVAIQGGLLQNVLRNKQSNWYGANQVSKMIGTAMAGLGIKGMLGNITKKQPVMIIR